MARQDKNLNFTHSTIRWLLTLVICMALSLLAQKTSAQESPLFLTLQESIEIALERNLEVLVAQEEIEVARQQKKEARTNFLPKFSVEYGYTRPSETEVTFGGVTFENTDKNQWRLIGTIDQPLFTGLANLSTYQLAKLGLDVAKIQLERTRLDIILTVKQAYYGILSAERLLEVAEQSVRQLQEGLRVAESFYRVGLSPKVDVLDAEVRLAEAEREVIRTTNDLQVARARLNTILRQPINTPLEVEDVLSTEPYEKTFEDSREIALKYRPELLEAEKNVARSKKEITLVKSDYYPTITWSLEYNRRGDDPKVNGSPFTDRENWETGATATWTFFEWGKTRYATNQKRAQLRQAEDILEQVKDDVNLEVKTAYLTLQAAEKAVSVAEKSIVSAEENFRISGERYEEQVATATEVLDAQTRLTRAKANYTTALVAFNVAR
ncbi:MAG: TolC family protein, partial [Syntrophobacterales bacterium]